MSQVYNYRSPYEFKLATSHTVDGITKLIQPGRRLVGTIPDLNDAVFVLTVDDNADKSKIAIELSTYNVPAEVVAEREKVWLRGIEGVCDGGRSTRLVSTR